MFFLVPAHPGCPGQNPESRKTVVVVVVLISLHIIHLHCDTVECSVQETLCLLALYKFLLSLSYS